MLEKETYIKYIIPVQNRAWSKCFQGKPGYFNMQKWINAVIHIYRINEKENVIVSKDAEKKNETKFNTH